MELNDTTNKDIRQQIINILVDFNPDPNIDENNTITQYAADEIVQLFTTTRAGLETAARKQAAADILNLAHQYAGNDKTMIGSEDLRGYHYFNAINNVGDMTGTDSTPLLQPERTEGPVKFINVAPDDEDWTAHISILNNWQNPERLLRDILQYARSGPFHPADMHVNLIEQVFGSRISEVLTKLRNEADNIWNHEAVAIIDAEIDRLNTRTGGDGHA